MKLRAHWFLGFGLMGMAGCEETKPCNVHLRDGESFKVEVLSKADPALVKPPSYFAEDVRGTPTVPPSCGKLDEVPIGSSFSITLNENYGGNTCYEFVCPLSFPSQAEASSITTTKHGDYYICINLASKIAVSSDCEAQRYVSLIHDGDINNIYEKPDDDGTSRVTLIRALALNGDLACSTPPAAFPDAAAKHVSFCFDQWNVQLTPAAE